MHRSINTRGRRAFALLAASCGAAAALGACNGPHSAARYRSNLTPGLFTTSQTHSDVLNRSAIQVDTNTAGIWEELGRMGLWDRPSRVSRKPIPY